MRQARECLTYGPGMNEATPISMGKSGRHRYGRSRLILLAIGLAVVFGLFKGMQLARRNARKEQCKTQLKMVGLALSGYEVSNGSLPPAYLLDAGGKPVLSWRVRAAEHMWYNYDFSSHMDFSKPWNDPANVEFLSQLGEFFRCTALPDADEGITHYVAVVGPGTVWPGGGAAQWPRATADESLDAHNPILLVEWPDSDIHWAEPRDITVDEFVELFQKRRAKPKHGCILCLDTALEVHELPLSTDPETVSRLLMVEPTGP